MRRNAFMKNKLKVGMLVIALAFMCAFVLTGCDEETEYTLVNLSSYTVTGTLGSRSFSVASGQTIYVMGNLWLDVIDYQPEHLVNVTMSGGGYTFTFTNKW
jgi:hypothetical protein